MRTARRDAEAEGGWPNNSQTNPLRGQSEGEVDASRRVSTFSK